MWRLHWPMCWVGSKPLPVAELLQHQAVGAPSRSREHLWHAAGTVLARSGARLHWPNSATSDLAASSPIAARSRSRNDGAVAPGVDLAAPSAAITSTVYACGLGLVVRPWFRTVAHAASSDQTVAARSQSARPVRHYQRTAVHRRR